MCLNYSSEGEAVRSLFSIFHPCWLKIICRGPCIPSPGHSELPSTQTGRAVVGSGLLETTWGRMQGDAGELPDEGRYQCPGNGAPSLDEIIGGPRAQAVCHHWPGMAAWGMDWVAWLKPWPWAVSLKLGMEAAQTTCGENEKKALLKNKIRKKKKGYYIQTKEGKHAGKKNWKIFTSVRPEMFSHNFRPSVRMNADSEENIESTVVFLLLFSP